jgi:isopenicillin N synthase-like dioxygenase
MTTDELIRGIQRFTYKPDYRFEIRTSADHIMLTVNFPVPDSCNPKTNVRLNASQIIVPGDIQDFEMLTMLIQMMVQGIEDHEMNEWLKIDGVHVIKPHPEK